MCYDFSRTIKFGFQLLKTFSFCLPFKQKSFIINQQNKAANAYIAGVPASNPYNPYFAPGQLVPTILGPDPSNGTANVSPQMTQCVQQAVPMPQHQKLPRSDRIEVSLLVLIKIINVYFYTHTHAKFY